LTGFITTSEHSEMVASLRVLGVPTSMGAFAPGQEDAPAALRAAGLLERLRQAGVDIDDAGDLPRRRWTADPQQPAAQNVQAVAEVSRATADRVATLDGDRPVLVLGGDCSIELGVVAGQLRQPGRVGLLYADLHADLNTPTTSDQGAFDWMVVSHLIGVAGVVPEVTVPLLLEPDQIHYYGLDQNRLTPGERDLLAEHDIPTTPAKRVARDPTGVAREAVARMGDFDRLLVHLDVDLIDFNDLPLSENAGRAQGLPFDTVVAALGELVRARNLRALTVTELNPHHGAEDGSTLDRFVTGLVAALAG
jgi:arginase